MGVRTSVYMDDELHAAAKASGVPFGELVRRGLGERAPEEVAAQRAAEVVAGDVRDAVSQGLRSAAAEAVAGAHDGVLAEMASIAERAVRSALADMRGSY